MTFKRCAILFGVGLTCVALSAGAQSGEKYKIRLAPAPTLSSRGAGMTVTVANVVGEGTASASLAGKKLTVTGTFEKLASPITEVHLFLGPAMGARIYGGAPLFNLMVTKGPDGKSGLFNGVFELSAEQIDALKKGRIYLQVHSEGAPSGHLLGWLVK